MVHGFMVSSQGIATLTFPIETITDVCEGQQMQLCCMQDYQIYLSRVLVLFLSKGASPSVDNHSGRF